MNLDREFDSATAILQDAGETDRVVRNMMANPAEFANARHLMSNNPALQRRARDADIGTAKGISTKKRIQMGKMVGRSNHVEPNPNSNIKVIRVAASTGNRKLISLPNSGNLRGLKSIGLEDDWIAIYNPQLLKRNKHVEKYFKDIQVDGKPIVVGGDVMFYKLDGKSGLATLKVEDLPKWDTEKSSLKSRGVSSRTTTTSVEQTTTTSIEQSSTNTVSSNSVELSTTLELSAASIVDLGTAEVIGE
jgi:hypothetical protein